MASNASLFSTFKRSYQILRHNTEEIDGDTEDDSHISRCLRSYYLDSQRPYPDWLGPPPSSRSQSPALSMRSQNSARRNNNAMLSDIWDSPGQQQQQPQQQGGGGRQKYSMFGDDEPAGGQGGGYQGGQGAGGTSTQQKIRDRLLGRRGDTGSPPQQQGYQPPSRPPPQQAPPSQQGRSGFLGMGRQQAPQQREQKPYLGAGMPWDDAPPVRGSSPGPNLRRGAGGRSGGYR